MLQTNKIICGDCIKVMKTLPENSVDAIVTDPPYNLSSIVKRFGKKGSAPAQFGKDGSFSRLSKGFMGKEWDNEIAFGTEVWKEALRVLKPGGFLLSFGGTRTYHRLVCGIEDAGFEIRDTIMWLYGSGFPKSLNVGKKIDQIQGNDRKVVGIDQQSSQDFRDVGKKVKDIEGIDKLSFGLIENAKRKNLELTKGNSEWEGWGTALKPAVEPICVARKPLSEKSVALNVLKWGTGGINIDACRIDYQGKNDWDNTFRPSKNIDRNCWLKNKNRLARRDVIKQQGRFPANIILECTCDKLEQGQEKISGGFGAMDIGMSDTGKNITQKYDPSKSKSRESKFMIHTDPNCPCYMLDEQSGDLMDGWRPNRKNHKPTKPAYLTFSGDEKTISTVSTTYQDKGGASRFFYCAKASRTERNFGLENTDIKEKPIPINEPHNSKTLQERYKMVSKNNHPTVKPISLLQYLIKLVSKEGAVILDPFLGSGTTAIACLKLNRKFIGIEKEEEYVRIANARIKPFLEQRKLFGVKEAK